MATYSAEACAFTGLEATYNAAAAGLSDKVLAGDRTFLHVVNDDASPHTLTLSTPGNVGGLAIADPVATITNGESRFVGPLSPEIFGDPADGNLVTLTWDDDTGMTFAVVYLP
jgi:hypothetical protein